MFSYMTISAGTRLEQRTDKRGRLHYVEQRNVNFYLDFVNHASQCNLAACNLVYIYNTMSTFGDKSVSLL